VATGTGETGLKAKNMAGVMVFGKRSGKNTMESGKTTRYMERGY